MSATTVGVCVMGVVRIHVMAALAGAALVLGSTGVATASPPSVDNVVNVVGANVAAGKWGLAEKNIEALGATIRQEIRRQPVAVASNPVQARLDAVNERLRLIKADYQQLYDARTRINRASVKQAKLLIAQVRLELVQKLNLINARGAMDALDAIDTEGAEEIAGTAQRLQTQDRAVKYLSRLINDLRPAMKESLRDRTQLLRLNRQFTATLAKYGLTAGDPAVGPTTGNNGTHPRIAGSWRESDSPCAGTVTTYTQDAAGNVTSASGDIVQRAGCGNGQGSDWVGSNFRWVSANVLTYDQVYPSANNFRSTQTVSFSADGKTARVQFVDEAGQSGSYPWTKIG